MKFLRVGLIQTFLCPALLFCFLVGEADLLQAQVNLEEGLVAYYPFKGNSNDASGNNNHPVFNNANLTSDRFGQPNEAYHFNGVDNYMQILNSPSLNMPNTELSLSLWVKVNGFNPNCGGSTLIKKGREGLDRTGYYYLRFSDDNFKKGRGATCPAVPPGYGSSKFL